MIDENGWRPYRHWASTMEELRRDAPPMDQVVLLWNRRANRKNGENTIRIAMPGMENTCDCSHWMPYTEGMEMPAPPSDFSHFERYIPDDSNN